MTTTEHDSPMHQDCLVVIKHRGSVFGTKCFQAFTLPRNEQLLYDAQGQNFSASLKKIRITWADSDSAKVVTKGHECIKTTLD